MSKIRAEDAYHHGDLRQALIDAAMEVVTKEQDWTFSLRELARRAGVSHNAPYNHFADKRELLGAVAAVGLQRLRSALLAAEAGTPAPEAAMVATARAYIRFGVENPGLYRLMFGPELAGPDYGDPPAVPRDAASPPVRAVLTEIIRRGAREGRFGIDPDDERGLALTTIAMWSAVHGLTMLLIDNRFARNLPVEAMMAQLSGIMMKGLRARADVGPRER